MIVMPHYATDNIYTYQLTSVGHLLVFQITVHREFEVIICIAVQLCDDELDNLLIQSSLPYPGSVGTGVFVK